MNRKPLLILISAVLVLAFARPLAAGSQVEISAKDCRRLVDASKTGAAYEPGADVRGKKVKNADVDGRTRIKLPDIFSFSLDRDLSAYGASSQTSVGVIFFDVASGRLTYNGQPLNDSASEELAIKCRQLL